MTGIILVDIILIGVIVWFAIGVTFLAINLLVR
jgi:hypothetical protein